MNVCLGAAHLIYDISSRAQGLMGLKRIGFSRGKQVIITAKQEIAFEFIHSRQQKTNNLS